VFCFCFISHVTSSEIKLKQNCFVSVLFQFYFRCNHCLTCIVTYVLLAVKSYLWLYVASERADITSSSYNRGRLKEGANINRSLVALGNVIQALGEFCNCLRNVLGEFDYVDYARLCEKLWINFHEFLGSGGQYFLALAEVFIECFLVRNLATTLMQKYLAVGTVSWIGWNIV